MPARTGRPVSNRHKVSEATWEVWSPARRAEFNRVYGLLSRQTQMLLLPIDTYPLSGRQWDELRYNIARHLSCRL
jgi:hypothetical protein